MDYKKTTKEELIIKNSQLNDKIANLESYIETLKEEKEMLAVQKEEYRLLVKETNDSNERLMSKKAKEFNDSMVNAETNWKKELEKTTKIYSDKLNESNAHSKKLENVLVKFVNSHGALLKILQGATDSAIDLNAYMVNELKGG